MHTQVRAYNGHISKRHLIIIIKGNVARFPVQQFAETLFWQRRVWVFFGRDVGRKTPKTQRKSKFNAERFYEL